MFELSVFSKRQKITVCKWTIFRGPIQCAHGHFFTLWVRIVHRLILEHNSCRKIASFLPWSSKLLLSDFCTLWKLKTGWLLPKFCENIKIFEICLSKLEIFFFKESFLKLNFAHLKDKTPKFYVNFMIGVAAILKILQARWKKVDLCSVSLFKRK